MKLRILILLILIPIYIFANNKSSKSLYIYLQEANVVDSVFFNQIDSIISVSDIKKQQYYKKNSYFSISKLIINESVIEGKSQIIKGIFYVVISFSYPNYEIIAKYRNRTYLFNNDNLWVIKLLNISPKKIEVKRPKLIDIGSLITPYLYIEETNNGLSLVTDSIVKRALDWRYFE